MEEDLKQLLLADLCSRLPYGVIAQVDGWDDEEEIDVIVPVRVYSINTDGYVYFGVNEYNVDYYPIEDCTPCLRPMSSMTEEEKVQLSQYACIGEDLNGEFIDEVQRKDCAAYIDWLNKNHFDYRGLIPRGLALEAPEGMYTLKVR